MTQIYTMFHAGSTVENQAVVVEDQEGPPVSAVGINELTLQPGSGKGNVTNGRNGTILGLSEQGVYKYIYICICIYIHLYIMVYLLNCLLMVKMLINQWI